MIRSVITKADIVLAVVLAAACALLCWVVYGSGQEGNLVQVRVDGEIYGEYPLSQDRTVRIDTDKSFSWEADNPDYDSPDASDSSGDAAHHNQLIIKDGRAFMSEASCPDGYCLNQYKSAGGIDQSNQSLVCLPNKVVVAVINEEGSESLENDGPDIISGAPETGGGDSES